MGLCNAKGTIRTKKKDDHLSPAWVERHRATAQRLPFANSLRSQQGAGTPSSAASSVASVAKEANRKVAQVQCGVSTFFSSPVAAGTYGVLRAMGCVYTGMNVPDTFGRPRGNAHTTKSSRDVWDVTSTAEYYGEIVSPAFSYGFVHVPKMAFVEDELTASFLGLLEEGEEFPNHDAAAANAVLERNSPSGRNSSILSSQMAHCGIAIVDVTMMLRFANMKAQSEVVTRSVQVFRSRYVTEALKLKTRMNNVNNDTSQSAFDVSDVEARHDDDAAPATEPHNDPQEEEQQQQQHIRWPMVVVVTHNEQYAEENDLLNDARLLIMNSEADDPLRKVRETASQLFDVPVEHVVLWGWMEGATGDNRVTCWRDRSDPRVQQMLHLLVLTTRLGLAFQEQLTELSPGKSEATPL